MSSSALWSITSTHLLRTQAKERNQCTDYCKKKSCVKAIYLIPSRRPAEDFSKCSLDSGRWTVEASHFLEVLIIWKETTYYSRAESLAPPEDLNSEHC